MNNVEYLAVKHLSALIRKHDICIKNANYEYDNIYESEVIEIVTSMIVAIKKYAPIGSHYYIVLNDTIDRYGIINRYSMPILLGIIKSLIEAVKNGYLKEIKEFIHAALFDDFLEMSKYLLNEGFKDASAVLIGGVLEEHIRKLCDKNNITILINNHNKNASTMNDDLKKIEVYNQIVNKNITAWLDLRNNAAHAKYEEYTHEQVRLMYEGVKDFISRFPA